MGLVLAAVLAVAELGGGFGPGFVTGSEATPTTMELELTVGLRGSPGPVVVHLALADGEQLTRPMVERGGRTWGAILEVRRADWQVVFEDVVTGDLSEPASLTRLGLDPALLGVLPPTTAPGDAAGRRPWGWLAVAVVAAVGTALALRAVPPPVRPRHLRRWPRFRRSGRS